MEEYTEEILEAVKQNYEQLYSLDVPELATFLENVSDSVYDGSVLAQVASALRDVDEGLV